MAQNSNSIFFIILLENQIVIHSFANRAQPSSHKLSGDVIGMVLLGLTGDIHCNAGSCFDGRI